MNPLNPYHWLLGLGLIGAVLLGYTSWRNNLIDDGRDQGRQEVQKKWDADKIKQFAAAQKAEAENRRIESERQKKVTEAQNEAAQRAKTLQAAADRARAQSDSLRNDLAAIRASLPSLTRYAVERYADTASAVFGECSRAYQELAGTADRISSERQTLIDAWPKR